MNVTAEMLAQMAAQDDEPHCDSVFLNHGSRSVEIGIGKHYIFTASNLSGAWVTEVESIAGGDTDPGTDLVEAIDVSSYQPRDLTHLIAISGAKHVVVRMYQSGYESPSPAHSVAQVESARANGCTVGMYGWLYAGSSAPAQVQRIKATADLAGVTGVFWLDIEPYGSAQSLPSSTQIRLACGEIERLGLTPGLYTNRDTWNRLGQPQFPAVLLWIAHWDDVHELLNVEPFGGMQLVAKQYTDTAPDGSGLDRDVFLSEYTA